MNFEDFHNELLKAATLSGDSRRLALEQLEPEINDINDEEGRRLARYQWRELMEPVM